MGFILYESQGEEKKIFIDIGYGKTTSRNTMAAESLNTMKYATSFYIREKKCTLLSVHASLSLVFFLFYGNFRISTSPNFFSPEKYYF